MITFKLQEDGDILLDLHNFLTRWEKYKKFCTHLILFYTKKVIKSYTHTENYIYILYQIQNIISTFSFNCLERNVEWVIGTGGRTENKNKPRDSIKIMK